MKKLIDRRKKITIDDLLGLSDINDVLSNIEQDKHSKMELISVWSTKDDKIAWSSNGITASRIIYLFEIVKRALLSDE